MGAPQPELDPHISVGDVHEKPRSTVTAIWFIGLGRVLSTRENSFSSDSLSEVHTKPWISQLGRIATSRIVSARDN